MNKSWDISYTCCLNQEIESWNHEFIRHIGVTLFERIKMSFEQRRKLLMKIMKCNVFGSQKPHGTCRLVPFVNHPLCRIPSISSGLKNGNDALAEDAASVRSLKKKLRVCEMQMHLWRMKINEKDEVWGKFVGQKTIEKLVGLNLLTCFTCAILCPVNPTRHDSEVLRLRTESLERLNLQIESERRDVGMPRRVPGFSLKFV